MDGDDKEDGWRQKMNGDMTFFRGRMPGTAATNKMDSNNKEDRWCRQRRYVVATKKRESNMAFFWGKNAIDDGGKDDG